MAKNPINLAVRFVLELAAWASFGYWGWTQHEGVVRWILAIGMPVIVMINWATFREPGHPGDASVAVPGIVRLGIEALTFGCAVLLLIFSGRQEWALILGIAVLIHYALSYDYVWDLLRA